MNASTRESAKQSRIRRELVERAEFSRHLSTAIEAGLSVLADTEPETGSGAYDCDEVRQLVEKIGVARILEALRDAADCASDVALGSETGTDFFGGSVTSDDLKKASAGLNAAISSLSLGRGSR